MVKKNQINRDQVENSVQLQGDARKMKNPISNGETWAIMNGELPISLTDERIEVLADIMQRIRRLQRDRKAAETKRNKKASGR